MFTQKNKKKAIKLIVIIFFNILAYSISIIILYKEKYKNAGTVGLEPTTYGFGDQYSTN